MKIMVSERTSQERADWAELLVTVNGQPRAMMMLALDPAGFDSEGLAGAVRDQLCDLVDRMDDWIRKGERLVVMRDEPGEARRNLFAGFDWLQGC
jgi:hypothetical protein